MMKSHYRIFGLAIGLGLGLAGCQQEATPDDKGMRQTLEQQKAIKADELPDNVPQWVKEQVKAGERRNSGGGVSAPPPSAPPAGPR